MPYVSSCPICGGPGYLGLNLFECANGGCENYKPPELRKAEDGAIVLRRADGSERTIARPGASEYEALLLSCKRQEKLEAKGYAILQQQAKRGRIDENGDRRCPGCDLTIMRADSEEFCAYCRTNGVKLEQREPGACVEAGRKLIGGLTEKLARKGRTLYEPPPDYRCDKCGRPAWGDHGSHLACQMLKNPNGDMLGERCDGTLIPRILRLDGPGKIEFPPEPVQPSPVKKVVISPIDGTPTATFDISLWEV